MATTPTSRTAKTILGVQRQIEALTSVAPIDDAATTLNTKYSVEAATVLNNPSKILYFGVGIKGFYNVGDGTLSEPNEVRSTNMDLYQPLPIRCVPFEQDLTSTERADYRMRQVITVGADQYVCYWLKKLTVLDATVQFTQSDSEGVEQPYVIDYGNLSPTPPDPAVQGVVDASANTVNVSAAHQLLVQGSEIQEAINVLYAGDMRYAKISELGLYMGEDQVVSAVDFNATPFNYTEAIFTQLALHHTWNGIDLSAPDSHFTENYAFTSESMVLTA